MDRIHQVSSVDYERVFLGLSAIFFVSLLYSFFALSLAMISFGVLALFDLRLSPVSISWRGTFPFELARILDQPSWWVISIPFFLVFFGAFYSDDTVYWLTRIRIKLPFLLFPLAFFLLPPISKRCYQSIHLIFLVVISVSTLPVIWQMLVEYDQILLRLQQGQAIDTPGNHIRYSLLTALAALSGFLLWKDAYFPRKSWQAKVILIVSLGLCAFLHFLAVRSGLVVLYFAGFILWLKHVRKRDLNRKSIYMLLGLLLLPLGAYLLVPSFNNRVHYMLEDISKYRDQKWNAYSDSERILSIRAGLAITRSNWPIGVGPGDIKSEMRDYFYKQYDKDTYILPHNQFVTISASSGIVGLLAFFIFLLVPLFSHGHYRNEFFLAAYIVILISLIVENTFETSVGVAIFIFFSLIGLNQMKIFQATE